MPRRLATQPIEPIDEDADQPGHREAALSHRQRLLRHAVGREEDLAVSLVCGRASAATGRRRVPVRLDRGRTVDARARVLFRELSRRRRRVVVEARRPAEAVERVANFDVYAPVFHAALLNAALAFAPHPVDDAADEHQQEERGAATATGTDGHDAAVRRVCRGVGDERGRRRG